jgi:hypothetical protein
VRLVIRSWLALLCLACGGPQPIPLDGGRDAGRDGAISADGNGIDASQVDAAGVDANGIDSSIPDMDADVPEDDAQVISVDAAPEDGGPLPDVGRVDPDFCSAIPAGTVCASDAACPSGERCLDNGCGERRCFPAGQRCADETDCPTGSMCLAGADANYCSRPGGGCNDARDCPNGFSCDGSACVDRRIACGTATVCPKGYFCHSPPSRGSPPFCVFVARPCATDEACFGFGFCREITGAGRFFCETSIRPCSLNSECTVPGEVCGVDPEAVLSVCQQYGPCADGSDCAPGFRCVDLNSSGSPQCVPTTGCNSNLDCTAPAVCASPPEGGPPTCYGRALGT